MKLSDIMYLVFALILIFDMITSYDLIDWAILAGIVSIMLKQDGE